jgi:hypothetical protein
VRGGAVASARGVHEQGGADQHRYVATGLKTAPGMKAWLYRVLCSGTALTVLVTVLGAPKKW